MCGESARAGCGWRNGDGKPKEEAVAHSALSLFQPAVREWFSASLGEPTRAQALGWPAIFKGDSTLLLAPTGSGKTLAAFLSAINKLTSEPPPARAGVRVLYVSPLKALAVDVERNLRAPLAGIAKHAEQRNESVRVPTVVVRTGDTPAKERARMRRHPPDILITTPESLYLVLTSLSREILETVETVIVDEIHSMVATKRGAHLFVSLERLEALRPSDAPPLQRIGLSATQRPLKEVARLLGGYEKGEPRPVTILEGTAKPARVTSKGATKKLELTIEVPDIDLARIGEIDDQDPAAIPSGPAAGALPRRSIWPHLHQRLVELVRAHRSTMIFTNSRRLAERLASALNDCAGEEIALAHHGSVSKEKRAMVEDRLKRGDLPAIVATSSLELGIDMGAVDLVVQIEAPPSIASGLQRVGRGGHSVGDTSRGILFPKHRADLLACATATRAMHEGNVEETFYPRNPLDILAQQIVAITAGGPIDIEALYTLMKGAAPFAELPRSAFEGVLDMLSGRYPSDRFAELRPRILWDRARGRIAGRKGSRQLAIINGGTIPDRGLYGVFLAGSEGDGKSSRRVGELDEEMVFEMREGEVFLLGASSWRIDEITRDRVMVVPASGVPGRMPFWHGDRPGRPREFGEKIGKLTRLLAHEPEKTIETLIADHGLNDHAIENLRAYVHDQAKATGDVPSDRTIVLERFTDELGDFRICLLTPFGSRVHAPWSTAIAKRLAEKYGTEVEMVWTDDGILCRLALTDDPPSAEDFFPPSSEIEQIITSELDHTSLFASRFRECAGRALLLPKRMPTKRTPLWAQRKRSADLLSVASEHPSFPILLETYRECLRDVYDMPGLIDILRRVEQRQIRVLTTQTDKPSPFAASLLFSFVGNFIYDGDAPLAERRVQALSIDHAQLRELLGEAELRTLLDADALIDVEQSLQRRHHPLKHADALHDLLLFVGDLSESEIVSRSEAASLANEWVSDLERERRILRVRLNGEIRFIAVEDAGRYRDALGVVLPQGIPSAHLEPVADPTGDLIGRYARTQGPFVADDIVARFGFTAATVERVVDERVKRGLIVEGAFLASPRPGSPREFCDAEVLRSLRQKSLARLRREVEPVDQSAYARFLIDWHRLKRPAAGSDALLEAIAQLEGCPLPASVLLDEILPRRVRNFQPHDLDMLCASGQVVWAGVESLGPNDGRIALYLPEHEPLLALPAKDLDGETHIALRNLLERRGAVFFADFVRGIGGYPAALLEALWDLVWAGVVTNDTTDALRKRILGAPHVASRRERSMFGRKPRSWQGALPGSEGRWSLRKTRWIESPSETEKATARAHTLLQRYGVLTREVAHAEGIAGGFSSIYPVLKAMEEAGRIRRGYFVAGRGATQFALPGADDRLRSVRDGDADDAISAMVVSATDPANPYGASLPWPSVRDGGARAQRAAGAYVVLWNGHLIGYLGRRGEQLIPFLPEEEPARGAAAKALAAALGELVDRFRFQSLLFESIEGMPALEHPLRDALLAAGFVRRGANGLHRKRAFGSRVTSAEAN